MDLQAIGFDAFGTIGVVPIFVNVGAAVLPAVIAGLTSAASALLRPKELLRTCIHRPHIPAAVLAVIGGLVALVWWLTLPGAPARAAEGGIAWQDIAMEIIARRELGGAGGQAGAQTGAVIFRQNVARTGYAGGGAPRQLGRLWRYRESAYTMYLSSPAVYGNWVYGASCVLDPPGNYGSLFCLDAATKKPRWQIGVYKDPDTGKEVELKGFFSSPALTADGKYLVVGQGLHYDKHCSLLCFRAEDGKLHWRIKTPLHLESSPAIRGDLAVVGVGAIEDEHMNLVGLPGYVVGVRISDGRELWRFVVTDPESSPVIAPDGIAYIGSGFNGCELLALRTETDEQLQAKGLSRVLWRRRTPYPATGAVTLTGDMVLIGCGNGNYVYADPNPGGAVIAYDRRTGEELWRVVTPDAVLGAVAVSGSVAICPVRDGQVMALDLDKAGEDLPLADKLLWSTRVSGSAPILAAAAFTGEYVYAVSKDGYLAVIDASNGEILEKLYVNDEMKAGPEGLSISSPVVAGGRVFVGSETGGVQCWGGRVVE